MKTVLLFLVFLFAGFTLISGFAYWQQRQQNETIVLRPQITTNFSMSNAPSESLKGNIASMSGTVRWLSRTATEPIKLLSPRVIQQGEALETEKNAKATVIIQNAEAITLSPNSYVNFIQLLPLNLVLEQNSGDIFYQNTGQSAMSIHTLDLLTAVNRGSARIAMDKNTKTVTVTVEKGLITEGYEDSTNMSTVVTVNAGQRYVFDDATRTGMIEQLPGYVSNNSSFLNR